MRQALALIIGLASVMVADAKPAAMQLAPASDWQDPTPSMQFLEDPSRQLAWKDLRDPMIENRFRNPGSRGLNFGFTDSAYWYRFAIDNPGGARDTDWVLEISWPPLDEIDLYIDAGNGEIRHIRSGEKRTPGISGIQHRNYALPFTLLPGASAVLELRVQIDGAHQLPARLWTAEAFARKTARENLYFGMFYGAMIVMIIYNLLMYLAARDAVFLAYVLFLGSITGLLSLLDGFAQPLLWPIWPPLGDYATAFGVACSALSLAVFTRVAMQTRERNPRLNRVLSLLLVIAAVCLVTPLAIPLVKATMINAAVGGISAAFAALIMAIQAIEGRRSAQVFACLWMVLLAGIVVKVLQVNGILPVHPLTVYAIHIGLAVLATTVSLTLAETLNSQRREQSRLTREKAEARALAQREFLTKMSHELRTPMNAIIGFTDLALRDDDNARRKAHLAKIDRGARALLRTVNDVLDLSRLESGGMSLERRDFALPPMLARLDEFTRQQLADGVAFQMHCEDEVPVVLQGDEWRLEQLLSVLLGNAAKFTPAGEVSLNIACRECDADDLLLEFRIADTGIGIPEDRQPELFKPFAQADQSMTREYDGSGLGLAICKQIVDAMDGQIALNSGEGRGSRFTVRLRFGKGQASGLSATPVAQPGQRDALTQQRTRGRRVLLVEDNAMNQDLAIQILEDEGVQVDTANNGAEAVAAVEKGSYDLVLMDVQMPVMDGFAATRRIRESCPAGRLPIVAMTANALPQDRQEAAAAGMNDFLPKPIDADQVVELLRKWLPKEGLALEPVGDELGSLHRHVAAHEFAAWAVFERSAEQLRLHFNRREVDDLESALAAFDFERSLAILERWIGPARPAAVATAKAQ